MSLKFREENQVLPSFESLMDDDSIVNNELSLLASNIKREVINVLDFCLSFLKVHDKRKAHNIIFLMLDPRYKNFHIIYSFVGREQGLLLRNMIKNLYIICWSNVMRICILWRDQRRLLLTRIFFYQDCSLDIFTSRNL
jgi:hypothetical protein